MFFYVFESIEVFCVKHWSNCLILKHNLYTLSYKCVNFFRLVFLKRINTTLSGSLSLSTSSDAEIRVTQIVEEETRERPQSSDTPWTFSSGHYMFN